MKMATGSKGLRQISMKPGFRQISTKMATGSKGLRQISMKPGLEIYLDWLIDWLIEKKAIFVEIANYIS